MEICIFIFTLITAFISMLLLANLKDFISSYNWDKKYKNSSREQFELKHAEIKDYLKVLTKQITQIEQTLYSMQHRQDVADIQKEKVKKPRKME